MVGITVLICWFVLVSGTAASSPNTPQNDDARDSVSTPATALSAVNEDSSSAINYHLLAGRLIPEKVEVKRSEAKAKQAIDTTTTNVPDKHPGATRIAILLALLILSAMLIPMAFAEPKSTSLPSTSLTLPSSSPCTTAFNATGMAMSAKLQEKDKPQTWYWIVPNSSERAFIDSLSSLIPFLLMVFFLLLPSFVAGNLEKHITIVDDMVVGRDVGPTSTSPAWEIFFSTNTVWLPAVTVTAPREASSSEPTEKPVSVAGDGGGCGSSAEVEICTEVNPAVCPVVLGRKRWKVV
ncbi:hypothetical protein MBLNU13_g08406t1 [Cladosporium sp. NU13]